MKIRQGTRHCVSLSEIAPSRCAAVPCGLQGNRVVREQAPPLDVGKPDLPELLEAPHQRLHAARLGSVGKCRADETAKAGVGPRVRLVAANHKPADTSGSVLVDPETKAPSPGPSDEVGPLDHKLIQDRDGVGDAKR
jgi:hypothetical protein